MCEWGDTVPVEIRGVSRSIDRCLAPMVRALNNAGIGTLSSCCGHGKRPGNIALVDRREMVICRKFDEARAVDAMLVEIEKSEDGE